MNDKEMLKSVEILAPAGSIESMVAAYNAGADAVYMGGSRFGARAYADNPEEDQMKQAIDYAHMHGKKLYMTVNTLFKERELEEEVYDFLAPYYKEGLDGVIIQDLGLMEFLRVNFPKLPLHASTQMTITGTDMTAWLEKKGMERIVLARELSLEEIRKIRKETHMEIEVFVQGALCYCYSGQCLMSSMIGGRSGNRGRCAQPCRLPYEVDGDRYPSHLLSPKDMCALSNIPDLVDSGIDSFKIEGRMKKPEYAAMTAWLYRHYTDRYLEKGRKGFKIDQKDMEKLMDLYNRGGFSNGYLFKHNGADMIFRQRPNHMGVPAGTVDDKGCMKTSIKLNQGDVLESRRNDGRSDQQWTMHQDVECGKTVRIDLGKKAPRLKSGAKIYRMRNQKLIDEIHDTYVNSELKEKIKGHLSVFEGQPVRLKLKWNDIDVSVSGAIAQQAKNRPMLDEQLRKPMMKTGNTPFVFEQLTVDTDGACFVPNQQLNELRRQGLEQLQMNYLKQFNRKIENPVEISKSWPRQDKESIVCPELRVMLTGRKMLKYGKELAGTDSIKRFYLELNEAAGESFATAAQLKKAGKEVFFALPWIIRDKDRRQILEQLEQSEQFADGYLLRQLEGALLVRHHFPDKKQIFDSSIYCMNHRTKQALMDLGADEQTMPAELNFSELMAMGCDKMEMPVYGHQQLMVSAQCIKKTHDGCTKVPEMIQLTDRQHKHFYVYNECDFCYNKIYNGLPTMLLDKKNEILKLNPAGLRLHFIKEDLSVIKGLIESYEEIYQNGHKGTNRLKEFTRGHFARGVE